MPPTPVVGAPTYSPELLVWAAGYEELRALTRPPLYGEGFNLAIVDTGIRETHEKVNGRVVYSKNFTSAPMRDGFDHGTGVASIALAVVPLCNILNLKVLDDEGNGTEEEVVLAIDDAVSLHDTQPEIAPSVINLSLGAPDDGNPDNAMRVACRAAIARGIWVVASAGNEGPEPGTILCPACERYVGAVGSAKYEPFVVSKFSSRGPTKEGLIKPDALFFGEDLVMTSSNSDTATVAKSGTSFSVPFASGSAILYHEAMYRHAVATQRIKGIVFPPGEERLISVEEAMDVYLPGICIKPQGTPPGKDYDYGYGLPFGPLVRQALRLMPAMDISGIAMPFVMISLLLMVAGVMRSILTQ
jgi:serine protease AprX